MKALRLFWKNDRLNSRDADYTMSYKHILFDVKDGVAKLTLNRPDKLNSFNETMLKEMRDAVRTSEKDESIRTLLLTGAGRAFSAGQDLSERNMSPDAPPPNLGLSLRKLYNPVVDKLRNMEKPVICAVNGVAAGAGANMALSCDIVVAARSAKFIQAFCRLGLVPDAGGTWTLPRLVGHARAMGLALLGDAINAEQAEEWGLIWKCIDDENHMKEAEELAGNLAKGPTGGLGLIKRAMNASGGHSFEEQTAMEADLQEIASASEDYREGVRAFLEKRKPEFTGR